MSVQWHAAVCMQGKVRDTYDLGDRIVCITTDRQSAFDRLLASIPYKGAVLNQTAAWWFEHTQHIVPNAVLSVPDPNVTVMKKCSVFPVEFVVRGFMTGGERPLAQLSAAAPAYHAYPPIHFISHPAGWTCHPEICVSLASVQQAALTRLFGRTTAVVNASIAATPSLVACARMSGWQPMSLRPQQR